MHPPFTVPFAWLSTPEVAARLQVTRQHVYWLVRQGALEGQCHGGAWFLDAQAVARYEGRPPGRPHAPDLDGLVTIAQAAARLGVCKDTIYKQIKRGQLAGVRHGGALYLPECALATFTCRGYGRPRLAH